MSILMPTVNFTSALKRFYPDLQTVQLKAETIVEVVTNLDKTYPGLTDFIIDEHGVLRQHINIFIGDKMIEDRHSLNDFVNDNDEILIFQALSGG
jgi:sulfur-carrier protein